MSRIDRSPDRLFGWADVVFLAVLVLLARVPSLFFHYAEWDEAAINAESWAISQGQILYKDIFQIHPVLNFAIIVPFFHFLRPEWVPFSVKLMNLILVFLGALLIARIAFEWLGSRMLSLLGACIFIFYCSKSWALSTFGEFYTLFPILLSVWLLFFSRRPRIPVHFLTGFLWGVAFFFKQIAIFDAIGLYLGYLYLRPASRKSMATATALMALGFATVAGLISFYFWYHGALSQSWASIVVGPMFYARPGGARWSFLPILALAIFREFGVPLIMVAGGVYLARSHGEQTREERQRGTSFFLILLIWFYSVLAGLCASGRFYTHYLLQLVPLASMFPLFVLSRFEARVPRIVWVTFLLALTFNLSIHFAGGLLRLSKAHWVPAEVRQSTAVAYFIKQHTGRNDRIFVYNSDHLDIFFLSERLSNNGIYLFPDMMAEHMHDQGLQARKRKEFLAKLPAIMVVGRNQDISFESAWQPGTSTAFFEDVLNRNYTLGATVEDLDLYVRIRR